jgi:hypothetical protein
MRYKVSKLIKDITVTYCAHHFFGVRVGNGVLTFVSSHPAQTSRHFPSFGAKRGRATLPALKTGRSQEFWKGGLVSMDRFEDIAVLGALLVFSSLSLAVIVLIY